MVVFLFMALASAVELARCYPAGLSEEAYCGIHRVSENRSEPSGRMLDLNILVLPSVRANPTADPLFVLAGGPGQGASEVAAATMPIE